MKVLSADMSSGGPLTVGGVAELVGVDPRRIWEWARQEAIPSEMEIDTGGRLISERRSASSRGDCRMASAKRSRPSGRGRVGRQGIVVGDIKLAEQVGLLQCRVGDLEAEIRRRDDDLDGVRQANRGPTIDASATPIGWSR